LASLLSEVDIRVEDLPVEERDNLEVLSLTKRFGLMPQSERFEKRVATEDVHKYKVVRRGWIVYNPYVIWEGAIHALRRSRPGIVSPVYPVWRRNEEDCGFLDCMLRTPEMLANYEKLSAGAVNRRRSIKKNGFLSIKVALPSIEEQRKIARTLHLVRRFIEQQERVIERLAEFKKRLLHQVLTHGLYDEPQKQTDFGPVPQSWKLVTFSEAVRIKNGQVDPRQAPYREMLHVGPENIESGTGCLAELRTNAELQISSGNYHFMPGDILYSKIRPYLNKVALADFEGTCSADMYPLRPNDSNFERTFLFQLLLSDAFNKQAVPLQNRTGIPKINRIQLGSISLPRPPLGEQSLIGEMLNLCDKKFYVLRRKHAVLTAFARTLLHELITARIRVHNFDVSAIEMAAHD